MRYTEQKSFIYSTANIHKFELFSASLQSKKFIMKVAEIGGIFRNIPSIEYHSNDTFNDYDALIVTGYHLLYHGKNVDFSWIKKRKQKLVDFVGFKNIPIIYLPPTRSKSSNFVVDEHHLVSKNIDEFLPVSIPTMEEETGKNFIILKNTPFTEFLEKYKRCFGYTKVYHNIDGIPIAIVPHTNKPIAFYNQKQVFLPDITGIELKSKMSFYLILFLQLKAYIMLKY